MSQNNSNYSAINANAMPGFIPALDGMRAISILIVIISHLGFGKIVPGGFGVTVFFFVSGFLITRLLTAEMNETGTIKIIPFYMRRFLRLYPALLALVAIIGIAAATLGLKIVPAHLFSASFYFMNYYEALRIINDWPELVAPWGHLWSLAVEEHFYILFPVALLIFGRNHRARIFLISAAILIGLMMRIMAFNFSNLGEEYTYTSSECRFENIAWGALLAVLLDGFGKGKGTQITRLKSVFWILTAIIMLCISFGFRDDQMRSIWRYSLQGIALLIFVYNLYFNPILAFAVKIFNVAILRFIGRLSYSLYLWHWPVIWYFARINGLKPGEEKLPLNHMILAIGISLLCAIISYYCIEKPFFSLRKRFGARIVEEMKTQ